MRNTNESAIFPAIGRGWRWWLQVAAFVLGGPLSVANPAANDDSRWWSPGDGRELPVRQAYPNASGVLTVYTPAGPLDTEGHPFFEPLGPTGRACVTCHQPADGMSLSAATARERWQATGGQDPLFAAVDGSNCPDLPQGERASHSLLLDYGLIRIIRPWPPAPLQLDGKRKPVQPEFSIEVVRDPTGCNTSDTYGIEAAGQVSVYRRPRPVANLKFATAVGFPFEPKNGLPLPLHPQTGEPMSGNLTADQRVWTLRQQALDALQSHLRYVGELSPQSLERLVDFQTTIYAAQSHHVTGGSLTADGARGGPEHLAQAKAGVLNSGRGLPMWDEFDSWLALLEPDAKQRFAHLTPAQLAFRQSVARGVRLFRERTFLVTDNAGITDMGFGNPVRNDCNFCHNMTKSGMDVAPGQVDLGTTNQPFAEPAPHLPLFKLTCKPPFDAHPHLGREVYTTDPGLALTTGRCRDIGKITIQNMRGLAARAPYFVNGSAQSLRDLVDYYDQRYQMQLTEREKQDLTNLMSVL